MHNAKTVSNIKNVVITQFEGEIDDDGLKEELETRKHFLVESDMENGRHRVFNFLMDIKDAHTWSQKLDAVFKKLKCVSKLIVVFGFVLKNIQDGLYWYYYAHENDPLI